MNQIYRFNGGWRRRLSVALAAGFFSVTSAQARVIAPDKQAHEIKTVPGQFVVQLKRDRSQYDYRALEKQLNGKIIDQIRPDMVLIQRDKQERMDEALRALRQAAAVKIADPNYIYKADRLPNDTDFSKLWGLSNSGSMDSEGTRGIQGVDISAEKAWEITTGSKKVVVAVVDTGVDFRIPDLADNAWTNTAEANGLPGVDDDKNGYIDDIHGYDFASNDGDSTDDNSHGSHVSGTIGAAGDDNRGVAGVAWNVSIMAVKFLDAGGSGTLANAIKAIDYARINGAKIMNNSWGGGGYTATLEKAIQDARDADILFTAAAGNDSGNNDSYPAYPASYDTENIVSIAAVGNRGELAWFSNYGLESVDVAAPGLNIYSTVPRGFDTYSGTSMATPHVTGVAALILSENPNLSYSELKSRLLSYARPLRSLKGKVKSGGMVDAYYSLTRQQPPADPNDPENWVGKQDYQVSTPHPYDNKYTQTYTIKIPGAKRISAHFLKFETESGYDKVQFFNGAGESLGAWSGKQSDTYSPIAEGDTLVMTFAADDTVNGYGFDIDKVRYDQ